MVLEWGFFPNCSFLCCTGPLGTAVEGWGGGKQDILELYKGTGGVSRCLTSLDDVWSSAKHLSWPAFTQTHQAKQTCKGGWHGHSPMAHREPPRELLQIAGQAPLQQKGAQEIFCRVPIHCYSISHWNLRVPSNTHFSIQLTLRVSLRLPTDTDIHT